ncbi:MAG: serine/threonine-protein kinase [Acutalibacteraceae bacterium]|nr:serine/threonine-protein kinase [Acutalibacteraceae bacterium]
MLEIGSLVDGKYKILSKIGHGGMSIVYMAINEKANKTWAIKEVRKDGKMDFNTVRQGLMAEIETLKKLKHPNLPSIVDVIEDEDSFIIVMDYIEGRSLDKIIEESGAQRESDVVEWAKQLCDVFGYLHSRTPAIIYRDMKPANVMLKPDGNIMVIDFGTAKNYEIELGETTGIGTIGYAAPEQYIGSGLGRSDARTDIYCLGITLYHLLTNIDPCKNLINDKSIRKINPALSHGLDAIIQKCTQYQPQDRYQTCAELMYDLENYKELEPLYRKKQKRKLGAFLLTIILSVVFVISGVALNLLATEKATESYDTIIEEAAKTVDYKERLELYEQCIVIPNKAGEKDAYLGIIQTFKDDDDAFTQAEANTLTKHINNNKEALQANIDNYTEICFETGKLYWYYYQSGNDSASSDDFTGAIYSVEWFSDVPSGYKNYGMATAYANIGEFYRNIAKYVVEANDKGKYKPFFENLEKLMELVALNESESEIVRLELLEMSRSALHQYATKLKGDGITKEQQLAMYNDIEKTVRNIETTTDKTTEKKNKTISLLDDTKNAINTAYGTGKGGNE